MNGVDLLVQPKALAARTQKMRAANGPLALADVSREMQISSIIKARVIS